MPKLKSSRVVFSGLSFWRQMINNHQHWDIFCRVVDNYGDIGTCWRLARQLVQEFNLSVRLWVDDLASFQRICPQVQIECGRQSVDSIEVCHWTGDLRLVATADVVIEAFACELPPTYVASMMSRTVSPVWINLEYLTAEEWVEGCHGLPSPQTRNFLRKYFFFPGFTKKTGGLLRESDLLLQRSAFDRVVATRFWQGLGIEPKSDDELRISLFCYENNSLEPLLRTWEQGETHVRLLACPGAAQALIGRAYGIEFSTGDTIQRGSLTIHALPFLTQSRYDELLWACDLNFVRGEDSFVRAQWAGRPFVWQIYPQAEEAHFAKLDAFLDRFLADFCGTGLGVTERTAAAESIRQFWSAWNERIPLADTWQEFNTSRALIEEYGKVWVSELDRAGNLADNLVRFVSER